MVTKRPRCPTCGRGIDSHRARTVKSNDGDYEICHRKRCARANGLLSGRRADSFPGYWPSAATD